MRGNGSIRRGVVVGAVALVAAGVVVPWALARDEGGDESRAQPWPAAVAWPAPGGGPVRPVTPAHRAGAVDPEAPAAVRLPGGAVVRVVAVSSRPDGELDVPSDVRQAGWWRGGSRIGDPFGSVLVAGHVDSTAQGLGPFAELLSIRRGQVVDVRTATLRQAFRVISLRLVAQGTLPEHRWVFAPDGPHRLILVTCAPPYVRADGGYQNLAVVTARPIGDPVPKSRRR